jgi:hypothetical protein
MSTFPFEIVAAAQNRLSGGKNPAYD